MSVLSSARHPAVIQCNRCLGELKPFQDVPSTGGSRPLKCFLSNCRHILCQTCRMKFADQCSVCNQKCRFIEISRNMPEQFRTHFESIQMRQNLIGTVRFQQEQSAFITSRTIAEASAMRTKSRALTQTSKDADDTYEQTATEHRKLMIIFEKVCEAKKRRKEEKERQEMQQREEERKRRQMQNIQKRRTSQGFIDDAPFNLHGRGHGQGQGYAPVVAGAHRNWTPGIGFDDAGFDATPQPGFGGIAQDRNTGFDAFTDEQPFPDLNGQFSTPGVPF